jgi:hypothetical protein
MKQQQDVVSALKRVLDAAVSSSNEIKQACHTWFAGTGRGEPANDAVFRRAPGDFQTKARRYRVKNRAKVVETLLLLINRCQKEAGTEISRLAAWILGSVAFAAPIPGVKSMTPPHPL